MWELQAVDGALGRHLSLKADMSFLLINTLCIFMLGADDVIVQLPAWVFPSLFMY
jgi:hypothetical protein